LLANVGGRTAEPHSTDNRRDGEAHSEPAASAGRENEPATRTARQCPTRRASRVSANELRPRRGSRGDPRKPPRLPNNNCLPGTDD
jgi:hypothetical protein